MQHYRILIANVFESGSTIFLHYFNGCAKQPIKALSAPLCKMVIDMHFRFAFATALVLLASPAFVSAQTPGTGQSVKSGAWVFSADGHRIGRVEDVADGMAAIIYNGHMIHLSLDKLAAGEKGLVSALTRKEIDQL